MADDGARLIAIVEANTKSFENALKRLEGITKQSTDRMTASVKKLDQQVGLVGASMNKVGKLVTWTAAIGAAKQLAGAIGEVVDRADELVDAADKIGITTTSLKQLRYAAEQAGSSAGQMDEALAKLSKSLAEARAGSGDLRKLLLANGMSEAQIKALSFEQALEKVADLIHNAKDAQDAAKISTMAFGRQFDELAVTFKDGAAGLAKFRQEFNATHDDIGEAGDRQLASYSDDLKRLNSQWDSAVDHMVLYALTALEEIGRVEHAIVDTIVNAANAVRSAMPKSAEQMAKEAGAAAGAKIGAGAAATPEQRMNVTPTQPSGAVQSMLSAAAAAERAARVASTMPSVVPSAGAGGGGAKRARSTGTGMTTITTKGGLKATVASAYADQFEGLINELEQRITIQGLSSFRPGATVAGTGRPSQHRYGRAIDIDPAMNVGTWRSGGFSDEELRAMAARWGFRWGGDFRKRDTMHFDALGRAPMGQDAMNAAQGIANESERTAELWKSIDDESKSATESWQSAQDAIANANQAFKRDLLGGLIRDLEHGVKPAEALANALQKISDRLLDMALNAIFPDVGTSLIGKAVGGLFAEGGVMTSRGPLPLKKYRAGGIAHSPQVAEFGEGTTPEAYVPLPDGRRIPVNMRIPGMGGLAGAGGRQGVAVHNRVTVDPSPLFVVTTQAVARQAGHDAVIEAGDMQRRRPGGRH